jgi:GNAT superfamily N-acetyltransferase
MKERIRQARPADAAAMHRVRMSVQENRLTSMVIGEHDYVVAIEGTGRGWVVELQGDIVAFAVGNSQSASIWALFVEPIHEGRGYGHQLHDIMVAWLWEQGHQRLWLTTEPGTRAERFYGRAGWQRVGSAPGGEVRFELTRPDEAPREAREGART